MKDNLDRAATMARIIAGMASSEEELLLRIAIDFERLQGDSEVVEECRKWMQPSDDRPLRFTSQNRLGLAAAA